MKNHFKWLVISVVKCAQRSDTSGLTLVPISSSFHVSIHTSHAFFECVADHFVHSHQGSHYGVHWVSTSFERSKGSHDAGQDNTDQQDGD